MESIILYNVCEAAKIQRLASKSFIKCIITGKDSLGKTIEMIAQSGGKSLAEDAPADGTDSLVIFCGLTQKHLDKLLFEIRQQNINVDFKAVMTPSNKKWTLDFMLREMKKERFEYMRRGLV